MGVINPSYQQYWDNVNRLLWAANYFGLDPNALAQLNQRPLETLGKQTISSTNTENNGLGTFIGSYRENATDSKPEPPKPDTPIPNNPKPEVENPKPEIQVPLPTKPIQPLNLPDPKPPVNDPPKPEPNPQPQKPEPSPVDNKEPQKPPNFKPPNMGIYYQNSPVFYHPQHIPQFHPLIFNQPLLPFPFPMPAQFPQFGPPPPPPGPAPLPLPKPPANGPFSIQQPTITQNGETIVENLIGGLNYNCHGRPTGHYRDTKFCDVFHACVFGQQRKTYACPFVGEPQYFDDITRRCEFVRNNPLGCASNAFYNYN